MARLQQNSRPGITCWESSSSETSSEFRILFNGSTGQLGQDDPNGRDSNERKAGHIAIFKNIALVSAVPLLSLNDQDAGSLLTPPLLGQGPQLVHTAYRQH